MFGSRLLPARLRACGITKLAVAVVMCMLLMGAVDAAAATLRVTTTKDGLSRSGRCTLREAIEAADSPGARSRCGRAGRGPNTIVLGPGRYVLGIPPRHGDDNSSGDLNITGAASLTITGAGVRATTIDAAGLGDRVLSVAGGARVVLSRLSIVGGRAPAGAPGAPVVGGTGCVTAVAGAGGADAGAGGVDAGARVPAVAGARGTDAGSQGEGGASSTPGH